MTKELNADILTQKLGSLYASYGYARYKMSKFEEYDTYVENKDFLISDRVITFTDVDGKLLALKPDVTISIIKNTDDSQGSLARLYYNENVYRVSDGAHSFKEIMQMGLECIGDIDLYNITEVTMLAAKSLSRISENFVLDISHMGIVSAILDEACLTKAEYAKILHSIGEKNLHEIARICDEKGIDDDIKKRICGLVEIYGSPNEVLLALGDICISDNAKSALYELETILRVISSSQFADKINVDFSVVNDMNYYNGVVFKGYIEGIPLRILSGGQYDKLMDKMGKTSKALGFAIYIDLLEYLDTVSPDFDADCLVLYDDSTDAKLVYEKLSFLADSGIRAVALKNIPQKLRYREIIDITKGGVL